MATTCDFLLSCSWLRHLMSPAFQLVRNCFKMFVLFGWNPFYAGKTVPFVIYSLGRDINFDKFCSSLINYIFSQHVLPVYCSCSVLFAWTTGGCLLSQMNTQNLQKPPVRTVLAPLVCRYGAYYTLQHDPLCQGDRFELPEYFCTELQCSPQRNLFFRRNPR